MFNLGIWEILIIGVIALFVIGPERLPSVARKVARFLNDVKRTTSEFGRQFTDIQHEARGAVNNVKQQMKDEVLKQSGVEDIKKQFDFEDDYDKRHEMKFGGHVDDPYAQGIMEDETPEELESPEPQDKKEEQS